MSIRIVLADGHRIVRDGLRCMLSNQRDMEVVGEATTGGEALAAAQRLHPDVVVVEPALGALDGIEAARRIRQALPQTHVLGLSMHSDRRIAIQMLRAGATGYLRKDCEIEEFCHAIRLAAAGRAYLSADISASVLRELKGDAPKDGAASLRLLTSREVEVLQLLAEGKRVKEIARVLEISGKTVESHRQNIMDKLGIHNAIELARYALREGISTI